MCDCGRLEKDLKIIKGAMRDIELRIEELKQIKKSVHGEHKLFTVITI